MTLGRDKKTLEGASRLSKGGTEGGEITRYDQIKEKRKN